MSVSCASNGIAARPTNRQRHVFVRAAKATGCMMALAAVSFGPIAPIRAADPEVTPVAPAPAVNWVLPIFTDKEGYRSMTLRGSEVRPAGKSVIAVTDLSITIFSGDAKSEVDTMLLSPVAIFAPKENRARGDKAVRLIRDDVEVSGIGWNYDHATKKVSLERDVRVTFRAQLNDILK
jgi:hypothetical protein